MRKSFLFLFYLLLCLTYSCGDTETATPKSVILRYGDTKQLHIPANNSGNVWSTSNDFVATVSNTGLVKANHVGTATIFGSDTPVNVEVVPIYDLYEEPSTNWGISSYTFITTHGQPDAIENGQILYLSSDPSSLGTIYMFNYDELVASVIVLGFPDETKLTNFLTERYEFIVEDPDTGSLLFADYFTIEESRTSIMAEMNEELGWMVMYTDSEFLVTGGESDRQIVRPDITYKFGDQF